ncbi:DUF1553 domain-containing protein [Urbifossiella limnaea]|uniref:Planctomycete cytochrome C n=1 Tax=Urbifossiella limnaea TaxID=2528023 RepID=A0A517Y004_9BACT|nr:DUF1553 domain-containing protein [Urbifossiella limnaea]QDU23092.1 Planctomycete cytochrome C [Urbifossiella limnaea]
MPRLSALVAVAVIAQHAAADPPDFDAAVAPLLAARCLDCHKGANAKGGLDLSRRDAVVGKDGAVVPGKLKDSALWERVAAGEMPPKKGLPAAEKAVLKEWIEAGARWGTDPIDPFRVTTAARAGYDWWALQPPRGRSGRQPDAPNPIDEFVRAKLRDKRLSPSPPADPLTLLRRVTFDLTGLPPTPDELDAFRRDAAPDAYEKVVARLLASPAYGERWARHWLDVVRYGETDGFERNTRRPHAWPYRDWVIRALNADMPYDRFVRLQLAGDVFHPDDPDAVAATGFLVAGVHNTVVGTDAMRAAARQDEIEDLVGAVGQTFLGLTLNCARCHDHKFDPVSQTDYYRFAALLAGVGHGERTLPDRAATEALNKLTRDAAAVRAELAAIEAPVRAAAGGPEPVAAWDFRTGPSDLVGSLHAKAVGGVRLTAAGATFDGKTGYLRTAPLAAPLRAKTLEVWVKLDGLTQRGGGVVSVQTPDGGVFDAIVFGEQEPAKWMVGSDGFRRTKSFAGPLETDAEKDAVHVAITVAEDGTVTGYRNGRPYGAAFKSSGPQPFDAGKAEVVFGMRHGPVGGNKMLAATVVAARLYDRALTAAGVATSFAGGPALVPEAVIREKLSPADRDRRERAKERLRELSAAEAALRSRLGVKVYANVVQPAGVTRVLARGDVTTPRETVAPAALPAVRGLPADFGLAPDAPDAARRKALAEWVASPKNPLFARVAVNRLWHHHFGTGLVETPSDFGFNGGRPTHPELLDWLAAEFAAKGFSLKHVHRLIVTSETYRQASLPRADCVKVDADNRLLWRMKPRRLEGEAVRDAMLSAAGLLDRTLGGQGFSDYRERNFNGTAYFDPFDPETPEARRRSVYRFLPRGGNPGLLEVLDCPDPASAAPRRAVTTTPLQALALWNGAFALRTADALAARLEREAPGDVGKQVGRAWVLAFGREPTAAERASAERLVRAAGLPALARALFNANEFLTVG